MQWEHNGTVYFRNEETHQVHHETTGKLIGLFNEGSDVIDFYEPSEEPEAQDFDWILKTFLPTISCASNAFPSKFVWWKAWYFSYARFALRGLRRANLLQGRFDAVHWRVIEEWFFNIHLYSLIILQYSSLFINYSSIFIFILQYSSLFIKCSKHSSLFINLNTPKE